MTFGFDIRNEKKFDYADYTSSSSKSKNKKKAPDLFSTPVLNLLNPTPISSNTSSINEVYLFKQIENPEDSSQTLCSEQNGVSNCNRQFKKYHLKEKGSIVSHTLTEQASLSSKPSFKRSREKDEDNELKNISKKICCREIIQTCNKNISSDNIEAQTKLKLEQEVAENAVALCILGSKYFEGKEVEKNEELALDCFLRSANQGNSIAIYNVGLFYEYGLGGLKADQQKAQVYYQLSADQRNAWAQYKMGIICSSSGIKKDLEKAFEYFLDSAGQGYADAQCMLAIIYEEGILGHQDDELAFKYYKLAAKQNHPLACYKAATMYEEGQGVEASNLLALHFYRLSANFGNEKAKEKIEELEENPHFF